MSSKGTKEEKKKRQGQDSQYSPCLAGDAFTETLLMPTFRVSTGLHVEHRRPKAGDAPHDVWGLGV